jgi:putative chitinase
MKNQDQIFNPSSALLLQRAIESGISSPKELANIMGNAHVETGGFSTMHERFNYRSADRVIAVVSSAKERFDLSQIEAAVASRDPERIATILYENRPKLGNTAPGDGWKYHGRGYFQYTGRDNYARYGRQFGVDLEGNPDLAAEPEMAARLAIAYWKAKVVPASRDDVEAAAKVINGGTNGLSARILASERWLEVITPKLIEDFRSGRIELDAVVVGNEHEPSHLRPLTERNPHPIENPHQVIHPGDHNPQVQSLQQLLSRLGYRDPNGHPLAADGDFGRNTEHAVRAFQRDHGLQVDGVAGPATFAVVDAIQANPFTSRHHPHHALYEQSLRQVHAEESRRQIQHGPHSEALAGALTVEATRHGMARIDRVELNDTGTLVRAVQVSPLRDEPGLNRTTDPITTQQATHTPLSQSSEQARQAVAGRQPHQEAERHVQSQPAPSLGM